MLINGSVAWTKKIKNMDFSLRLVWSSEINCSYLKLKKQLPELNGINWLYFFNKDGWDNQCSKAD